MQKNHDSQVVTLDTAMYHELLAMAKTSQQYTTKRIERHVRKFNPYLQPEHQLAVRENEIKRTDQIRAVRLFKEQHVGEVVYAKVKVYMNTDMDACPLLPVIVKRISKCRWLLDVVAVHDEYDQKHKRYKQVGVEYLQCNVPDGYIQGVGEYGDYLVPENGIYDIREALKENGRKHELWLAEEAKRKANSNVPLLVDVCEER